MSYSKCFLRTIAPTVAAMLVLTSGVSRGQTPTKLPEFVPGSWTLILLPDTQYYSEQYPGLFILQTHWIVKNKEKLNIRYVLHLGDVTNGNTAREWQRAQDAMCELDGKVPYAIAAGNHDYTPIGDPASEQCGLNKYFPASKFREWPTFGGVMKDDSTTNSYHLFSAGGTDWIILALEWGPRNETLQWANAVLAKYPQRKAILVTHAYLYSDSTRYDYAKKGDSQADNPHDLHKYPHKVPVNDGEQLWQKLIRKNNFALTFNGHVWGTGLGFLSSKNDDGKTTRQMLVNYQCRKLGGESYLRMIEFLPDGTTVHVKSYSPLYDKYLEDDANQFSFKLDR